MLPVNQPERQKAFLNFLLLFVVTIAVILITVFFSVQVPFKENEKLRAENDMAMKEQINLQSFEVKMKETMGLIDSIVTSKNTVRTESYIQRNLEEMNRMLSDSSTAKSLCDNILDNLNNLKIAKMGLKDINNNNAEAEKKDGKIAELQQRYDECQREIFRMSHLP